jgi:hypothetical protein
MLVQRSCRRGTEDERSVDPSRHPERHDHPVLLPILHEGARQLAPQRSRQRRPRHGDEWQTRERAAFARLQQHHPVVLSHSQREGQLLEGQYRPGLSGNELCGDCRIGRGGEESRDSKELVRMRTAPGRARHRERRLVAPNEPIDLRRHQSSQ